MNIFKAVHYHRIIDIELFSGDPQSGLHSAGGYALICQCGKRYEAWAAAYDHFGQYRTFRDEVVKIGAKKGLELY